MPALTKVIATWQGWYTKDAPNNRGFGGGRLRTSPKNKTVKPNIDHVVAISKCLEFLKDET